MGVVIVFLSVDYKHNIMMCAIKLFNVGIEGTEESCFVSHVVKDNVYF